MAFFTLEKTEVRSMAETGIKRLKRNILHILMTFLTVAFDGKGIFTIVTCATGFPFFHIKHRLTYPVWSGYKKLVVTIRTGKRHVKMHFVTENRTSGQRNVPNQMAFDTVTLDRECCFTFMTASTGLTLLHLQHREMRITPVGLEQSVMTISATVHAQVFFMTEYN